MDNLEICLRDLNRDLQNHLFRQLRRSTPFDLATFIMDVTGLEDPVTGISRILLWDEVREPFSLDVLNQIEANQDQMAHFETLVS